MPRNPKATAIERGKVAERNYRAAERAESQALARRKTAMLDCLAAGCTLVEIGNLFGTSASYISNVRAEAERAGRKHPAVRSA